MSFEELPEILTLQEVAEYLRVSISTARCLLRTGKLKGINAGVATSKLWRVQKASLKEFIEQTNAPEPIPDRKPALAKRGVEKVFF